MLFVYRAYLFGFATLYNACMNKSHAMERTISELSGLIARKRMLLLEDR